MKKSKISSGISTLVLTVAGAFAVQGKGPTIPTYYLTQVTTRICISYVDKSCDPVRGGQFLHNYYKWKYLSTLYKQLHHSFVCDCLVNHRINPFNKIPNELA